ncbi:10677_t:CDS:2, partial [Diversispora eburnea]
MINTPVTFLTWLKGKYSTETVGSKQIAERFLSQEQFNPTDTPDIYRERIRPYLTYIPYADLLPYLYDHLPENIEVRMSINPPADINTFFISLATIYHKLNQKQVFQDFQKMLQDEFNKQQELLKKQQTEHKVEIEKLKAELQSQKVQKTQIPVPQTVKPVRQPRGSPSNLKTEEDYKNYYIAKYFNDLGIYSNEDLDSHYLKKPFQKTNQFARMDRIESKVNEIGQMTSQFGKMVLENQFQKPVAKLNRTQRYYPFQPINSSILANEKSNEGGYDEEKDICINDLFISESFLDNGSEFGALNNAAINVLEWKVDKPSDFDIKGNSKYITESLGWFTDIPVSIKDKDGKTVTATGNFIRIDNGELEPMLYLGMTWIRKVQ